jgi:hypothetical protein
MVLGVMLTAVLVAQATPWSPPSARHGFQGSLTVQRAVASGDMVRGLRHREYLPAATEVEAHLGWKLTDRWLAGVYLGGGVSTPGDGTQGLCEDGDLHCTGTTRRAGVMVKLDVLPARAWNPWIAVGSGVARHDVDQATYVTTSTSDPAAPTVVLRSGLDMRGVEPLRLMTGIDFRSARALGLGVHAGVSLGRYRDVTVTHDRPSTLRPSGNLADGAGAWHTWFTFGMHGLLFP